MKKYIQSVIFSKDYWSLRKARKFLKELDLKETFDGKGVDETEVSYRFRQARPLSHNKKVKGYYYTTEHPNLDEPGISYVMINKPKVDSIAKEIDKEEKKHKDEVKMKYKKIEIPSPFSIMNYMTEADSDEEKMHPLSGKKRPGKL